MTNFALNFSNNVIQHLGVKLYQNKPTKVITEYVSNSWDAGAEKVLIFLSEKEPNNVKQRVVIADNGCGMTATDLRDKFLIIGADRRKKADETIAKGRKPMGRKGIGKLAGFGVAQTVEIITKADSKTNSGVFWLRFSLPDMLKKESLEQSSYKPKLILDNAHKEELIAKIKSDKFLSKLIPFFNEEKSFTCVYLSDLSLAKPIKGDQLSSSLSNRLGRALLTKDFDVSINDKKVVPTEVLPQFYPLDEFGSLDNLKTDHIEFKKRKLPISYWAKFVDLKKSDWTIEQAGVGIYAHNKIVQERPFFFNVKGSEIISRYLYACVYADWLDETNEDLVSTDRSSLNWDEEITQELMKWGENKVRSWLKCFVAWKESEAKKEISKDIEKSEVRKTLSLEEVNALESILVKIYPLLEEEQKEKALSTWTDVWTNEPMRRTVDNLWKELSKKEDYQVKDFPAIVEALVNNSLPEILNVAVTVSQRIGAIASFTKLVEKGSKEMNLQNLIERFPWILGQDMEKLTANQTIKRLVEEKISSDEKSKLSHKDESKRPDFVYMSTGEDRDLYVFELKGAESDRTLDNKEYKQLRDYLDILTDQYSSKGIHGYLIGHEKGGVNETDNRIQVVTWSEILDQAKKSHMVYLEALLKFQNDLSKKNKRVKMMTDFGGKPVQDLIAKILGENSA